MAKSLNEEFIGNGLSVETKQTTPPDRYSEATLVKKLQDTQIGRPSTYATIVETVLSPTRGYSELHDKKIIPTEKGIQLSNFLDRSFSNIINLSYTKEMEEDLDLIAEGKMTRLDFLNSFFTELEDTIKANIEDTRDGVKSISCPKCGKPMVVRRSRYGKLFYGCSDYPQCNGIVNIMK